MRLYIIISSLMIFLFFAVYTQVLIQNAKREQEFVPRLFAQFIAYTDAYLRESDAYLKEAEKSTKLLSDVVSNYFNLVGRRGFQQELANYITFEFMPHINIPIIITDENLQPMLWQNVDIPANKLFSELSYAEQSSLKKQMENMTAVPLYDDTDGKRDTDIPISYAYYSSFRKKPVSFEEFTKKIDYSVIVADRNKIPMYWKNVDIDERVGFAKIATVDKNVLKAKMATMHEIPLSNEADSLGFIYFSHPKALSHIRYMVILELLIAFLLIVSGSYGLLLLKRTEKDSLWIGLAKETAHQFGTPITSLMGWLDYLKDKPSGLKEPADFQKILGFMTADLEHLRNIASRIGKVGSKTKLISEELQKILETTVDYFSNRIPHLGAKIEIFLISKIQGVQVLMDSELIKWTLENLIKNCVDAMSKKGGSIIITATQKEHWVYVLIRDEGKGIPRSNWKKIFEPGVTTKTRGWGLGLSLAKRIIEEYHQGHIRVIESAINEGTTIEIKLHTGNEA
ncbi:MAG: HAMP domain-containing sensor histidine kinase [Candidatus Cloacimonetes bacterium]|nr:HAMP domain-containing sensor histidine kinase [Candidatus Cloacimonadota bacterium]